MNDVWDALARFAASDGWSWALPVIAAALALALLAARRDLSRLHRALRRALEGDLEPVPPARRLPDGTAIGDYNVLARRLRSLFDEMERSQLAIIGERNRIDAILRGLPCVMLVVDDDLCVTSSNGRAEALLGRGGEELRGRNLFDVLELDTQGREVLREAFLYEQQVTNRAMALGAGDARRHFTLGITFFKSSPEARDPCAVIMLQDVTDYRRLQEVAHQSEKLVAIGQLAGGVAHELNTPLGTIVGYARLLNAGGVAEAKRAQYAQVIHDEARRCARIIDNLLTYARRGPGAPESCDINEAIREVVATLCTCPANRYEVTRDGTATVGTCGANRYNVPIELDLEDAPAVIGESGQLDIVLANMLTNALQATAGAVPDPRVAVASRVFGGNVIVTVTDNGPGVAPEARNRVFDPFFSTKWTEGGTGLGLAISQSIVAGIGGTLRHDPAFGSGARFVLTLSVKTEDVHAERARA
jgi:signal transduction histidine kinase